MLITVSTYTWLHQKLYLSIVLEELSGRGLCFKLFVLFVIDTPTHCFKLPAVSPSSWSQVVDMSA
jgi:hypothetical protein